MKNKILLLTKITLFAFISIILSGCWNARELNGLSIVVGIGIDKADIPGNVLITAQIVKPNELKKPSKTEAGGEGKAYSNIENSSETVFDAVRGFTHEISNRLYISHNQVIIFGKEIADEGIQKYLDFFMRAAETRPTTSILVSKGTAGEVLDVKPQIEKLPSIEIQKLIKAQDQTSQSTNVNLQELTSSLLGKTTSAVVPLIAIKNDTTGKVLEIDGMAAFKGDKMAGELTRSESRGFLWIKDKIKTGVVVVPIYNGKASIEIKKAKSSIEPEEKNGKMIFHVKVIVQGILAGQTCPENLATVNAFQLLEKSQVSIIDSEIKSALNKARELNLDIFGFGEEIHKKYRKQWKEMEKDWENIFPSITVVTDIKCQIKATGLITKPAVPEGEK